MADTLDLDSSASRLVGSSPTTRTKQVFIRGELFNRHETHHQDECNIILGLMAKIQPDLYEDVIKALPDHGVWQC